ncbi:MAG: hypothetical protein ACOCTI_04205 [Phycisphaeraceae bacterium]
MRSSFAIVLLATLTLLTPAFGQEPGQREPLDLAVLAEVDLGQEVGQFRACPVRLPDGRRAVAAIYAGDREIDPWVAQFFFPKDTLKLIVFDTAGEVVFRKDLGPGMVPGIWFSPIFAFDMDQDGADEIYLVGNEDEEHPLRWWTYRLWRIDPMTGEKTGEWTWPRPKMDQRMSFMYRHFIVGGYVDGEPVLITANGTYGPVRLTAYNGDMSVRWEAEFAPKSDKLPMGSHMTAVVDHDDDGVDALAWGERYVSFDTGESVMHAGKKDWSGHSDVAQPVLDRETGEWWHFSAREWDGSPRVVMAEPGGEVAWTAVEEGHMDTGWAAHLGGGANPTVFTIRLGGKSRTQYGESRSVDEEFAWDAFTGKRLQPGFDLYTTIPVDLDGDGYHELVRGYFEGDGTVLDAEGREIGQVGPVVAIASKFCDLPGEQLLTYEHGGSKVQIWRARNAIDSDEAKQRYEHPFYYVNQQLPGVGYNYFNLGGL